MRIVIKIDAHAYAHERLCDDYFNDAPSYGIVGPEIMQPLSKNRGRKIDFEYDENTCITDLILFIKHKIWGDIGSELWAVKFAFLVDNERYYIGRDHLNFNSVLHKYLDTQNSGEITLTILVSYNAGDIAFEHPLRYYVNSREAGSHHEAHIHVRDIGYKYEASIRISDGEMIVGNLPRKLAKLAKKKILSDQIFFYKCWNTMTDGLHVDINKHYGYIDY